MHERGLQIGTPHAWILVSQLRLGTVKAEKVQMNNFLLKFYVKFKIWRAVK
jgi:hypothetical protein